jgi:type IV pilus assembly protein PilN
MKVTLNLATRPFTDLGPATKRLRIGMGILAGLCLLFILGLHLFDSQAEAARAREHSLDGDIARIEAQRQAAQAYMQQPDNAQLLKQAEFLNDRFAEKAFSWTLAMEAMETVLPAGVEVTSIEPQRTKKGEINVEIRVLGPHNESVDLVRNLERSRRFIAPRIDNEAAESGNNPNSRMQPPVSASNQFEYELFAGYNPPTSEELAAQNSKAREKAYASHEPHNPAAPQRHTPGHRTYPRHLPKPDPGRPANGGAR